jgi:hypothetical protein
MTPSSGPAVFYSFPELARQMQTNPTPKK